MYFTQCFNFQHKNLHQLHSLYHFNLMLSLVRIPLHFNFWIRFASCCCSGVRMSRLWWTYWFISHNAKFMFSPYIYKILFLIYFFHIFWHYLLNQVFFIPNDVHCWLDLCKALLYSSSTYKTWCKYDQYKHG